MLQACETSGFSEIPSLAVASLVSCLCQAFDLKISAAQKLCSLKPHPGRQFWMSVTAFFSQRSWKEKKDCFLPVASRQAMDCVLYKNFVSMLSGS